MNYREDKDFLKNLACRFRKSYNLGENPIPWNSILSDLDIFTLFRPLSRNCSGICIKTNTNKYMLINSDEVLGRQHYTICHEIYHLFYQTNFYFTSCNIDKYYSDDQEYNANIFASYLILPSVGINNMIPAEEQQKNKIKIPTLLKIQQYYGCSYAALINRLKWENYITREKSEELRKISIKHKALKYGYHTDLYETQNLNDYIFNYQSLAKKALDSGKITNFVYDSLLLDLEANKL